MRVFDNRNGFMIIEGTQFK